jgi:hypothetical protein
LYFDFRQGPYAEYDYWLNNVGIDGHFIEFPASLCWFSEWTVNYMESKERHPFTQSLETMHNNTQSPFTQLLGRHPQDDYMESKELRKQIKASKLRKVTN